MVKRLIQVMNRCIGVSAGARTQQVYPWCTRITHSQGRTHARNGAFATDVQAAGNHVEPPPPLPAYAHMRMLPLRRPCMHSIFLLGSKLFCSNTTPAPRRVDAYAIWHWHTISCAAPRPGPSTSSFRIARPPTAASRGPSSPSWQRSRAHPGPVGSCHGRTAGGPESASPSSNFRTPPLP